MADPAAVDVEIRTDRVSVSFEGEHDDDEPDFSDGAMASLHDLRTAGDPLSYGRQLLQTVFRGKASMGYKLAVRKVHMDNRPRQLRLKISQDESLNDVWWEGMFDADSPVRWLACFPNTPLSRYLAADGRAPAQTDILKILAVISNPADLGSKGDWSRFERLKDAEERRIIQSALGELKDRVLPKFLTDPASPTEIREWLLEGPERDDKGFHVLHLVAPSYMESGKAFLVLEQKGDQEASPVDEDSMAELIAATGDLQLVMLAGTPTSSSTSGQALTRIAKRLVDEGLPAAVAMRDRLPTEAAETFTRRFYAVLGRSLREPGWVDSAVNIARDAVKVDLLNTPNRWDWLMPVLFLRGEGRLFEPGNGGELGGRPRARVASAAPESPPPRPAATKTPENKLEHVTLQSPEGDVSPIEGAGASDPMAPTHGGSMKQVVTFVIGGEGGTKMGDEINITGNVGGFQTGSNAKMGDVTQQIGYDPAELTATLEQLVAALKQTLPGPDGVAAAAQLEVAKAQAVAGDPREQVKGRLEKAGELLEGSQEVVKKSVGLLELLKKAAKVVGAVIAWL